MSNTSYYLYQKYVKYGSQDWIPVYPVEYAISGDTGQDPVIKSSADTNCGYCPPEYRWKTLPIGEDYICSVGNKYYKEVYQVSNDCGFNWENVVPESARTGNLYESGSSDCIEYRWVDMDISTDYICDDCPDVEYRWVSTTGYVCSGTNKMTKEIKQYSYDSGATWQNVVPEESRAALPMIESASTDCGYIPYSKQYLSFVPTSGNSTFGWNSASGSASGNTVYYSLDSGSTWNSLSSGQTVTVNQGNKIYWKKDDLIASNMGVGNFTSTNYFDAEGNIMSLISGDSFENASFVGGYKFRNLFSGNTYIVNAENLILPAEKMSQSSYESLFDGCTSLVTAPELPATIIYSGSTTAYACYRRMFNGCISLIKPPSVLPAEALTNHCYVDMFNGCVSLTTTPKLNATVLGYNCYAGMFANCTNLTTAPELPATTLASSCYSSMFSNCTNLTTAPELPATTLPANCYTGMFMGCTSLITFPDLPEATLDQFCCMDMFNGCTSLTTAPKLPSTTLVNGCYAYMFSGCTSLNSITCLATNPSTTYTVNWLVGVSSTGTFTKASTASWTRGTSGVPTNWTVQNYS